MNKEELTPCKGLPGWYCNEDGEIYSFLKSGKGINIKGHIRIDGYVGTSYKGKSTYLHTVIASTFLYKANDNLVINHKDGDKANNKLSNLEYITQSQNQLHRYKVLGQESWGRTIVVDGVIHKSITSASKYIGCTRKNIVDMLRLGIGKKRGKLAGMSIYYYNQ